jgi:hypothetical protein
MILIFFQPQIWRKSARNSVKYRQTTFMKTRTLAPHLALALLLSGLSIGNATNTVLDFEGLPASDGWSYSTINPASLISNQMVSTFGISFTSESDVHAIAVVNAGLGNATSGTNAISGVANGQVSYGTPFDFTFWLPSSPNTPAATDFVSISSDLLPGYIYSATMQAFDINGHLLGSVTAADNAPFVLSLSAAGIHSVRIAGADTIAWDLLTFDNALVAVPEPSLCALGGLGALLLLRRSRLA